MATFPTLTPSSRTFTPGRHPHSEIPTLNGLQVRVMTSNVIIEQQLRLTFVGLTEAEMLSIRSHYIGQQGRFLGFFIPSSLLSGMTTPSYFTPTGYSWIYGSAPQVEDIPGTQRYTVSVELVTIPPEGANVNGAEFTVPVGLIAGSATTAYVAPGAVITVTASIEGGVVADNTSAGLDLTVSASMVSGTATGEAGSSDPNWANVRLLFGCNSLPATDESSFTTPIVVTPTAGVVAPLLDTTIKKFGAGSMRMPGGTSPSYSYSVASTNDNVDVPSSTPFTWECWVYFSSINAAAIGFANSNAFMESQGSNDYVTGAARPSSGANPRFFFVPSNNAVGGFYHQSDIPLITWIHWALVRESSNNIYIYMDGIKSTSTLVSSLALNGNFANIGFAFGKRQQPSRHIFNMDEIRITVGTARYTADFTPPTAAFPRS